jgi:hypothetical protein
MADRHDEPKSFLDRSIHWNDPAGRSHQMPLIGRPPVFGKASTVGLVVGLVAVAMALYDSPPNLGGILFAGAGLILAAISLFLIPRQESFAAEQDKARFPTNDGDPAP